MLTTYQASPGAYVDVETGELFCMECAGERVEGAPLIDEHGLFLHLYNIPDPEVTGLEPVIGYALDEMQSEQVEYGDGIPEGCTEECEPALWADCGHELRTAYHYGHPHEIVNAPAPRWTPCRQCGAGDGEKHRDNCPTLTGTASE